MLVPEYLIVDIDQGLIVLVDLVVLLEDELVQQVDFLRVLLGELNVLRDVLVPKQLLCLVEVVSSLLH